MTTERKIAFLNSVPVLVLGAGTYALPARYWLVDALVIAALSLLLVASIAVLLRAHWAARALRLALAVLLLVGFVLVGGFALSLAFLAGIHGAFGMMGAILMTLVLLLLVPYTLLYPALALWWLRPARGDSSRRAVALEAPAAGAPPASGDLS